MVSVNRKKTRLGLYVREEEAARIIDRATARLNFDPPVAGVELRGALLAADKVRCSS